MKFEETKEHLNIFVDYKLKDLFKSQFKTAKWNSFDKHWYIANTTTNKNKLNKFLEEINSSKINEIINEIEEIELNEKELSKLKEEIDSLKTELKNKLLKLKEIKNLTEITLSQKETAQQIHEQLIQAKEAIEAANFELEKAKLSCTIAFDINKDIISKVIDLDRIEEIFSLLSKLARKSNSSFLYAEEKKEFTMCQQELLEFHSKLEKIGFTSDILLKIANANVNRLDRDKIDYQINDIIKSIKKN